MPPEAQRQELEAPPSERPWAPRTTEPSREEVKELVAGTHEHEDVENLLVEKEVGLEIATEQAQEPTHRREKHLTRSLPRDT